MMKVARQTHKDTGVKKKKMEGAAMYNGQGLLDFLTVKVQTKTHKHTHKDDVDDDVDDDDDN